jgi:hypothetical protein
MKIVSKLITSGWLSFVLCWASQLQAARITLKWDPDPAPNLAGYRLYYGTSSGVYTQEINVGKMTATVVSNLREGRTYFFAITAYSPTAESLPSNEVSYKVPVSVTASAKATSTIAPPPVQTVGGTSKLSNIHDMQVRQRPRVGSVEAVAYARWCRGEP